MNNQDIIDYVIHTLHNTNPTILKQKLNEQDFENRSDWNQNDSTAPDYVKNRPFYETDDGEVVKIPEKFLPDSVNSLSTETWTFQMADGSSITKEVYVK